MVNHDNGRAHDLELFILQQLEAVQEQALEVTKRRIKAIVGLFNADFQAKAKVSS